VGALLLEVQHNMMVWCMWWSYSMW